MIGVDNVGLGLGDEPEINPVRKCRTQKAIDLLPPRFYRDIATKFASNGVFSKKGIQSSRLEDHLFERKPPFNWCSVCRKDARHELL